MTDSGEIFVDGKKADIANPIVATELGIGIVYQELNNFMHLDVASNILSHGLPQKHGMINYDKMYAQAREILDNIGLTHISEKGTMSSLSLGAQQMCEIAGIVSKNADIVIPLTSRPQPSRKRKRKSCLRSSRTSSPAGLRSFLYFAQAGRSIIPCG